MSLRLYINGQQADLMKGASIAQTKQVNDINSVSNRQSNYTNTFKLPMTGKNRRIMQYLSMPGNTSPIPYQKNECSLYSDSGECFVYKGWAIITESSDTYDCHIYDGIIDVFKTIENTNLSDLDLSELTHTKDIPTIKNTWTTPNNPYLYIVADYNGYMGNTSAGELNIDYLVPSVKVSYLWDKVFQFSNAAYSGDIFDSENFQNLYMTFPKGVKSSDSEVVVFESTDLIATQGGSQNEWFVKYNTAEVNELMPDEGGQVHLQVAESGTYRINIEGSFKMFGTPRMMYLGKNGEGLSPLEVDLLTMVKDGDGEVSYEHLITLEAGESICVIFRSGIIQSYDMSLLKLTKLDYNIIDFEDALIDFSTKDFVNEVLQRFALTMFKDKYTNNYTFLTQYEHLQTTEVIDWSKKMLRKLSENYVYGTYAQQNWFRYSYNDQEASHNDGFIDVSNVNLADKRDVIKSKIYSPETYKTNVLNRQSNVYKLWDKESEEDPDTGGTVINYKALDKRFYFLRAEYTSSNVNIYSEQLGTPNDLVSGYYYESYFKLSFRDIVQDYYYPLRLILNKATIINAELYLREVDVVDFDFKKLYYFEQFGGYFLVNKINAYIPERPTKCELIKVDYGSAQLVPPVINIYRVVTNGNAITVYFTTTLNVTLMYMQLSIDGSTWIQNYPGNGESPYYLEDVITGITKVRLRSGENLSNEVEIIIPSNEVYNG